MDYNGPFLQGVTDLVKALRGPNDLVLKVELHAFPIAWNKRDWVLLAEAVQAFCNVEMDILWYGIAPRITVPALSTIFAPHVKIKVSQAPSYTPPVFSSFCIV